VTKDLREIEPLPQDLAWWGSDRTPWGSHLPRVTEDGEKRIPSQRILEANLKDPLVGRDAAERGMGQQYVTTYVLP
jgi:hypothetical protein